MTTKADGGAVGAVIGAPMPRLEDKRLLTGQGRFTADKRVPGQLHAAFLRSPYANARIISVDTTSAARAIGVAAVFIGADLIAAGVKPLPHASLLVRRDGTPMTAPPRRALAFERVRHVGEAVAVVIAESVALAQDACALVEVQWDEEPAVATADDALRDDAPRVWEALPDNACGHYQTGDAQATASAFAGAAHVVRLQLRNNRLAVAALEPRAALAEPIAGNRLCLHIGCQMPHLAKAQLADVLGLPADMVRICVDDIGGAFGGKSFLYPEYVAVAWAARQLGRAVAWTATRAESFLADTQGRDVCSDASLALDATGRFLALQVHNRANVGAYVSHLGAVVPTLAALKPLSGVYGIEHLHARVDVVLTHTAPVDAYRGAGRPETIYIVERLVEAAAQRLGIDSVELRRRNMIRPEQMPYRTAHGEVYDSGRFEHMMQRALREADWEGFAVRRARSRSRGLLRGRGLAMFIESTGAANPTETVKLVAVAGRLYIRSGTQNMGQGLETAYVQIAAATLGLPVECVCLQQGDTDLVQRGGGSGGSRSLFIGGSALRQACELLLERLRAEGIGIESLFAFAERQPAGTLAVEARLKVEGFSWPNGCHVAETTIDPQTGVVRVVRYTAVDDVGVVVNPLLVHGQAEGAIVQGIGQALYEEVCYDRNSAQLMTGSFSDYKLARAEDIPPLAVFTDESSPCTTNPLGAKGAGEGGCVAAPVAVTHAVRDALLLPPDVELDMPFTPAKVWRLLCERGLAEACVEPAA